MAWFLTEQQMRQEACADLMATPIDDDRSHANGDRAVAFMEWLDGWYQDDDANMQAQQQQ